MEKDLNSNGKFKKRDKFLTSVFPGIIYLTIASIIEYATWLGHQWSYKWKLISWFSKPGTSLLAKHNHPYDPMSRLTLNYKLDLNIYVWSRSTCRNHDSYYFIVGVFYFYLLYLFIYFCYFCVGVFVFTCTTPSYPARTILLKTSRFVNNNSNKQVCNRTV